MTAAVAPAAPQLLPRGPLTHLSAVAGPMLIGACLNMRHGALSMLEGAVALPAIMIGVALLMAPALYIGAAFLGVAPSARDTLATLTAGLGDAGLCLVGAAPALAFLIATSTGWVSALLLGHLIVAVSLLLSLRTLFRRLFGGGERRGRALLLLLGWTVVAFGIGERLFLEAFLTQ